MADTLNQSFGKVALPIDADGVDKTLLPLDPARRLLTALFKSAINAELGEVWTKVTDTLPSSHYLRGTSPIEDTLEITPNPGFFRERKEGWPLFILYRDGTGTYEQHTLWRDKLTQTWALHYIVGNVDVAETHKFIDVLVAAAKVIRMVIRDQSHWSYQDGAVQFFPDTSALAAIDLKTQEGPGQASFAGSDSDTLYLAISMTLETVEMVRDDVSAYDDLDGGEFDIGLGGGEGIVPDLISVDTDQLEEAP